MTNCQFEIRVHMVNTDKCVHMVNKERKPVMWRKVETNLSSAECSPHENCGHKSILSQLTLFCYKISLLDFALFFAKSILSQFTPFAWRKI